MTWFDFAVLAILGVSVLLGAWRGVIGEVIALAAWIIGFFGAKAFGGQVAQALYGGLIDTPILRLCAGWATVFFAVLAVLGLVRIFSKKLIAALGMSLSDRLLGFFFGLVRGALIVLVLVALGGLTDLPKERWWANAKLAPPFETAVLVAAAWLPPDIAKHIHFR
ncbi:MAG: CvpA family protein [Zoogloeaceae bacterium]|jgi:membrane protein required for colicin V production|nr:CvpA family protein [Zoogloeaceae bacterium]